MINRLAELIDTFPGAPNRTRCFAHTLNLVVKCIMRQFDGPKKKKNTSGFDELNALADQLDSGQEATDDEGDVGDAEDEEIEDGAFDEREGMTEDEIKELESSVQPVQRVLVKVRLGT
jgi:hypothetical protein